ncbi:MAG: hypothetical protein U0Q15_07110 [Kineosporiaceae bacterium]
MSRSPARTRLARAAVVTATTALAGALGVGAAPAAHATPPSHAAAGAVFVQLNAADGNSVAAYDRAADGALTKAATYPTGGKGGTAVGAPVDALASQAGLVLARRDATLLAVNAGSDTITSFAVSGSRLTRASVVASGGSFPVSLAVRGSLVYVLNAGGTGSVSGFRLMGDVLKPIPDSTRSLGLDNATPPAFLSAPAQVGISPDGKALVVTTKANGTIVGFGLDPAGRPSATANVTASTGPVPFAFEWGPQRVLHVAQAGDGRLASYRIGTDGAATALGTSATSEQKALCWTVRVGRTVIGANPGSGTLSTWTLREGRTPGAVLTDAVAASPGGAPIDLAAAGRFVYVQDAVGGLVRGYALDGGRLTPIGTVTGLPTFDGGGMEGIAAY